MSAVNAVARARSGGRQLARAVGSYFTEPGSAVNLAIFRLIFFAAVIPISENDLSQVRHFARLPRTLLDPPREMGWFAAHVPIRPALVEFAFAIMVASATLAAIGMFTRIACWGFVASAFYYLTVPQLFGKVDHYHAVLWVALILAVSRCGDVWSVDALLQSRRDVRQGRPAIPEPSVAYSRPIRAVWLLLGVTYLLPGIYKLRYTHGLDWASARNMRGILYGKWFELGGYRPPIPLDYPTLLVLMGVGTIFFETTFIVWILFRRTRWLSPAMGVFFHTSTNIAMRIGFYSQLLLYFSFVNWERLSRRMLRGRAELAFVFDDGCGICRTTATALQRIVAPGGATFRPAAAGQVLTDVCLRVGEKEFHGFAAYRRLAWRTPVAWPALPLLYLPPVCSLGERAYAHVARSRACPTRPLSQSLRGGRRRARAVLVMLSLLLVGEAWAGMTRSVNAWPIAVYPTFAGQHYWSERTLSAQLLDASGRAIATDLHRCFSWMPSQRYAGLEREVIDKHAARALVAAASETCPSLRSRATRLVITMSVVATAPSQHGRVLRSKTLLSQKIQPG